MTAPKTGTAGSTRGRGPVRPTPATAAGAAPGPAVTGPGAPRDVPPRATPPPSGRGPGRPTKTQKRAERATKLAGDLTAMSLGLMMISPRNALAVGKHAENVAGALADLAEQNTFVAKLLDGAAVGGAWLGVATATLPLAVEVLANLGALGAWSPMLRTRLPTDPPEDAPANLTHLFAGRVVAPA